MDPRKILQRTFASILLLKDGETVRKRSYLRKIANKGRIISRIDLVARGGIKNKSLEIVRSNQKIIKTGVR